MNIKVHVREDLNLNGLIVAYEIDISDCSVQLVTDIKSSVKRQKLKMGGICDSHSKVEGTDSLDRLGRNDLGN